MSAVETRVLLDQGQAVVVDVRSAEAYADGHIAGAISVPLNRLQAALPRFSRDKTLVFYWTWRNEQSSARAAQIVNARGFQGVALRGGLQAWEDVGFPVAVGAASE